MSLHQIITEDFRLRYGDSPTFVVRAPGRVNLIGEHTDYNDGFVLPMAIDRAAWIALRPRTGRDVVVHSLDFGETLAFDLDGLHRTERGEAERSWIEYLRGVAWALQQEGYSLQGWEGVMVGDVPIGAGLSSSAAIELATARAFAATSGFDWEPTRMALLGQRAENQWLGVRTGIMDQMISACGKRDHALLIDCRSLETKSVPLPEGTRVVVLDTATRRGLVDSAYNERREQCEAAARFFKVPALRDVSLEAFEARAEELEEVVRRRARHVVTENERTLQAAIAMQQGDAVTLGRLMDESHVSMRDDFEISSDNLNRMVEIAREQEGCYGARMTGGGFAGCAVALVRADVAESFATEVALRYREASGLEPNLYVCQPTNGAELIPAT